MLQKSVYGAVECRFHWQLAGVVESVPQSIINSVVSFPSMVSSYFTALPYISISISIYTRPLDI